MRQLFGETTHGNCIGIGFGDFITALPAEKIKADKE